MKTNASKSASGTRIRSLTRNDLEIVVDIERSAMGRSRRGFFDKRLRAAEHSPEAFITVGAERQGRLVGFVIASVLEGEFGRAAPVAILDAVGVTPEERGHGVGHDLLAALDQQTREQGIDEMHTQTHWNDHALLRYFDAAGFTLAKRCVLERSTHEPARF
ncbi:MAG: GNAT family N-acetyltransferase [Gammaproteobacteria bacterium]|nr:GNAT family N-acetyltransferase [Gammaproteobacteria bacterium]NIR84874.1 GNAT family N-acetyltransferase [Gammaproteobacteria bacterium]NIR91723.1 GNAT family N-acetyltransferase [Gammaproteobacteria bacterium]NIU05921.1 GNAT family N-acetyltransferase [Gammaproteobacteria bacterium]NIV52968.1 GNAT family N-acetyltransferase [Gammaproteobacteria bacterium]